MLTLEEYKLYLINNYVYEYDNTKERRLYRKGLLERDYSDDKLIEIINDTYDFIKDVLNSSIIDRGYFKSNLEKDTTSFISLNLVAGTFSDTIFTDSEGRIISRYITEYILGKQICIGVNVDIIKEVIEDEDAVGVYFDYYLYMQGFPKNIEEIKNNLFSQKILQKTIRRKHESHKE